MQTNSIAAAQQKQQQHSATSSLANNNNNNSLAINNNNNNISLNLNNNNSAGTKNLQHHQANLVIKSQVAVSMSPGITSTAPGLVTVTKTINQAGNPAQSIVGTSMLPASVQIVRPGAPATQQNQQKTVATVQPRVVIGTPMVTGARPTGSAITLSTLQNLNAGPQGPTLLLKTENGQYQLVRVGPAPMGQQTMGGAATTTTGIVTQGSGGNQTIRLQTVPAPTTSGSIVVNAVSSSGTTIAQHSAPGTIVAAAVAPPVASVAPVPALAPQQQATQAIVNSGGSTTTAVVVTTTPQQQQANQQNTKEKCRKFLANLLELSSREPKSVEKNVRVLIQELIDANVEPEEFCDRLERLLNASPQPCLIGFLKKSLPMLRQSLVKKELTIDGIKPPPHHVAFPTTTITTNIPATVRPIGQTIMAGSSTIPTQVRMVSPAGPRPTQTTITRHTTPVRIQGPASRLATQIRASMPPALQPVSGTNQIKMPTGQLQIRTMSPAVRTPGLSTANVTKVLGGQATTIKVGQTQIKQINSAVFANSSNVVLNSQVGMKRAGSVAGNKSSAVTAPKSVLVSTPGGVLSAAALKEKEKKSFYQMNSLSSSAMYGDDDINDVAAMGGVNLAEESQRILGSTELIGTQIRSCKDEVFLNLPALQSKICEVMARHGLETPGSEVAVLISHAAQERLKNIVEKLAVIAEHRLDVIKLDPRYEVTKDVRGQIKFLEELDKAEQKRHEEQEREMLLRAAKSRSKTEDPEQAKLKAKAKEMQRAEMEELRQRDANLTALQAIGQRKKPRLDGDSSSVSAAGSGSGLGSSGISSTPLRPRIKRVNMRDILFYLEQERETCRNPMLYKAYLK